LFVATQSGQLKTIPGRKNFIQRMASVSGGPRCLASGIVALQLEVVFCSHPMSQCPETCADGTLILALLGLYIALSLIEKHDGPAHPVALQAASWLKVCQCTSCALVEQTYRCRYKTSRVSWPILHF